MTDLTAQIEELEGLLEAATEGPWSHASDKIAAGNIKAPDNALAIVALRNLAPAIIADWKRLKAENEAMAEALKPFAVLDDDWVLPAPDDGDDLWVSRGEGYDGFPSDVTFGDIRRAAALVKP